MTELDLRRNISAEVFDIRKSTCVLESKILVDTNVLYFTYYDRYDQLGALGGAPRTYQKIEYPSFIKRLLHENSSLFVHRINLLEFAKVVELTELKLLHCRLNGTCDLEGFDPRSTRLSNLAEWEKIRRQIPLYMLSIVKRFRPINLDLPINQIAGDFLGEWQSSLCDAADAMLLTEAKSFGLTSVLSDDAYFATVKGIRLYTANNRVL